MNDDSELKAFAIAANRALSTILERTSDATKAGLDQALANGCQVAISFAVASSGISEIHLDVVNGDSRFRVATVESRAITLQ